MARALDGRADREGPLDEEVGFFQTEGARPFTKERRNIGRKENLEE
jgi:hypothetical protein